MSAYIEDPEHIAAIVGTHEQRRFGLHLDENHALNVATMLARENVRSVNRRYHDRNAVQVPTIEQIRWWFEHPLAPADLIQACRGLNYQSCEHAGWEKSAARKYLLEAVFRAVPHLSEVKDSPFWSIAKPTSR
jgi:hypothetical protein